MDFGEVKFWGRRTNNEGFTANAAQKNPMKSTLGKSWPVSTDH
jgi:hypothetical protein